MTPKVPMMETVTATAGMTVARTLRRNQNTTRITRMPEMSSVSSTSCSEPRMGGVRSSTTDRLTAPGRAASSCGSSSRTLSTVSMMLAPGWRNMITMTAGLPLTNPAARRSSTESWTVATSESRTAAPLR